MVEKKNPRTKKVNKQEYDQLAERKAGNSSRHTDDSDIRVKRQRI